MIFVISTQILAMRAAIRDIVAWGKGFDLSLPQFVHITGIGFLPYGGHDAEKSTAHDLTPENNVMERA